MIAQTNVLGRLRKPALAVSCALLCLLPMLFSAPATGATDNSFPSSFYVTFKGDLGDSLESDNETGHAVQFLNGTYYLAKTVLFTFSMEESLNSEYTVKFTLTLDNFYYEVNSPATVSNGRVYIDSTPTMFVVNPKDLISNNVIQIFQTEKWSFSGTVMDDGGPVRVNTLIKDYHVSSIRVKGVYQQPDGSTSMFQPLMFYDLTTGVLVASPEYIMDEVLFNKVGVALLYNGNFRLFDYSENLNFTLWDFWDSLNPSIVSKPSNPSNPSSDGGQLGTTPSSSPSNPSLPWLILIPVLVAVFILVGFLTYKSSSKKKKSGRPKTNSNNSLKIHPAYASKEEGTAYGF